MRYNYLITLGIVGFLFSCASNPAPEADYIPPSKATTEPVAKPLPARMKMTYHNQASTLEMDLDPYDENMDVRMTRTPDAAPEAIEVHDTIYLPSPSVQVASPAPSVVNPVIVQPQVQTMVVRDTLRRVDTVKVPLVDSAQIAEEMKKRDQEWQRKHSESLVHIRRAQSYFYKKDYASAWRLTLAAQEALPTAEGYALQGSIQYMLGDKEQARHYWSESVKMDPSQTEAVEALSKLGAP